MQLKETGHHYQVRYHVCETCGAKLVAQRIWNKTGKIERREMKAEGHAKQGVGPHCAACSAAARRAENA